MVCWNGWHVCAMQPVCLPLTFNVPIYIAYIFTYLLNISEEMEPLQIYGSSLFFYKLLTLFPKPWSIIKMWPIDFSIRSAGDWHWQSSSAICYQLWKQICRKYSQQFNKCKEGVKCKQKIWSDTEAVGWHLNTFT